jgi:hypothetical protein
MNMTPSMRAVVGKKDVKHIKIAKIISNIGKNDSNQIDSRSAS